jgi:hypothetical protein
VELERVDPGAGIGAVALWGQILTRPFSTPAGASGSAIFPVSFHQASTGFTSFSKVMLGSYLP